MVPSVKPKEADLTAANKRVSVGAEAGLRDVYIGTFACIRQANVFRFAFVVK